MKLSLDAAQASADEIWDRQSRLRHVGREGDALAELTRQVQAELDEQFRPDTGKLTTLLAVNVMILISDPSKFSRYLTPQRYVLRRSNTSSLIRIPASCWHSVRLQASFVRRRTPEPLRGKVSTDDRIQDSCLHQLRIFAAYVVSC
jgi:hypothetical protein